MTEQQLEDTTERVLEKCLREDGLQKDSNFLMLMVRSALGVTGAARFGSARKSVIIQTNNRTKKVLNRIAVNTGTDRKHHWVLKKPLFTDLVTKVDLYPRTEPSFDYVGYFNR